jgi:hypothetical protein
VFAIALSSFQLLFVGKITRVAINILIIMVVVIKIGIVRGSLLVVILVDYRVRRTGDGCLAVGCRRPTRTIGKPMNVKVTIDKEIVEIDIILVVTIGVNTLRMYK